MLTGKVRTKNLPITETQLEKWANGEIIQNVFPNLSADDREFLISGSTAEEWEKFYSEED